MILGSFFHDHYSKNTQNFCLPRQSSGFTPAQVVHSPMCRLMFRGEGEGPDPAQRPVPLESSLSTSSLCETRKCISSDSWGLNGVSQCTNEACPLVSNQHLLQLLSLEYSVTPAEWVFQVCLVFFQGLRAMSTLGVCNRHLMVKKTVDWLHEAY